MFNYLQSVTKLSFAVSFSRLNRFLSSEEMSRKKIYFIIGLISFLGIKTEAQNYHATNGSAYAGSVGLFNNPASGINSVYKWDLNLFSFQTTATTNNIAAIV